MVVITITRSDAPHTNAHNQTSLGLLSIEVGSWSPVTSVTSIRNVIPLASYSPSHFNQFGVIKPYFIQCNMKRFLTKLTLWTSLRCHSTGHRSNSLPFHLPVSIIYYQHNVEAAYTSHWLIGRPITSTIKPITGIINYIVML